MPKRPPSHAQLMRARNPRPDDRPSPDKRGYDWTWKKLRKMKLNENPMCQHPLCDQAANEVDHVIAKARGGTNEPSNLQSLCKMHHSMKTAKEDGAFGRARVERDKGDDT